MTDRDSELLALDREIVVACRNLEGLMQKRLALASEIGFQATRNEDAVPDPEHSYRNLKELWGRFSIDIPPYEKLAAKLEMAERVAQEIMEAEPRLAGDMDILLVPPIELMGWPVKDELRGAQGLEHDWIHFGRGSEQPTQSEEWRVFAADVKPVRGIKFKSAKSILRNNEYEIAGYDTRGLGVAEYAAMSLQCSYPIDAKTETYLLLDYYGGDLIWCGTLSGSGCYRVRARERKSRIQESLL